MKVILIGVNTGFVRLRHLSKKPPLLYFREELHSNSLFRNQFLLWKLKQVLSMEPEILDPHPMRILFVEDSLSDAELIVARLKKDGFQLEWYRVDCEPDFISMLDLSPDLILADWNLPQFSGLRAIELKYEYNLAIPLIVISGILSEEEAVDAISLGADDCILKDHPQRLGQAIRKALHHHQLHQVNQQSQENLSVNEQRLRALLTNAPVILFSIDTHGVIQFAGGNNLAKLGLLAEQVRGKKAYEFFPGQTEIRESFQKAIQGEEVTFVGHLSDMILDIRLTPVFNQDHVVTNLIGVAVDITDRSRAEDALKKRVLALTRPLDQSNEIEFEELFNMEDIQTLQDQFARALGVASVITHPDGQPITRPSNFCRLCSEVIRKTDKGLSNCMQSDARIGRYHPEGPIIQPCLSGGLWDAGASIHVGGRHIANWLIGQVRNEVQTEEKMRAYANDIGADEDLVMTAFRDVPSMSEQQFASVARVLFTIADQLSNSAYQNIQQARFITDRLQAEIQKDAALEELKQKIQENERFKALMVNREIRMVELKQEINTLLRNMNQPEKYRIVE